MALRPRRRLVVPLGATSAFVSDGWYAFAPLPNDPLVQVYPKLLHDAAPTKRVTFADVAPEEMARQLTLLASEIYMRITTNEVKSQAWAKENAKKRAPNVSALIAHFNRTSYMVRAARSGRSSCAHWRRRRRRWRARC